MVTIICPHCNETVEIIKVVALCEQDKEEPIYKTRLEMAKENVKPIEERQWIVIEYDSKNDRFLVIKGGNK